MKTNNKLIKRILAAIVSVAVAMSIITVPQSKVSAASGTIKKISVTNLPAKQLTLKKGRTFTLKTRVSTSGNISKALVYKTSNPKIATVSSTGIIKARRNGKANITITSKANKKKKITIRLTVGTPAAKVNLNKTSASIYQNTTLKLTATVSPVKASEKRVIWSSSNKKIATVSDSGIVKGINPGTATITATARDGSGKKKTCKVTVKKPITITSVSAHIDYRYRCLNFTLSEACACELSDISIYAKQYKNGKYIKTLSPVFMYTNNNRQYSIIFDDYDSVYETNDIVKISIPKLGASKEYTVSYSKQTFYRQKTITATMGEELKYTCNIDSYGMQGAYSCSAKNLPAGIKYDNDKLITKGYMDFYGTPAKAGVYNSQFTFIDELGNTMYYTITFVIGAPSALAAAYDPIYEAARTLSFSRSIKVSGGSGAYTYEIIGDNPLNATVDTNGKLKILISKPCTTTIKVKVTDDSNPSLTTVASCSVNIHPTVEVSGKVTTSNGFPVKASITYTSTDSSIYGSYTYNLTSDGKGIHSQSILPGTYNVTVRANGAVFFYPNIKITGDTSNLNFTLPLYTINISSDDIDLLKASTSQYWSDEKRYYDGTTTLYLPKGKYALTSYMWYNGILYECKLNINVTGHANVKASAKPYTQ